MRCNGREDSGRLWEGLRDIELTSTRWEARGGTRCERGVSICTRTCCPSSLCQYFSLFSLCMILQGARRGGRAQLDISARIEGGHHPRCQRIKGRGLCPQPCQMGGVATPYSTYVVHLLVHTTAEFEANFSHHHMQGVYGTNPRGPPPYRMMDATCYAEEANEDAPEVQ